MTGKIRSVLPRPSIVTVLTAFLVTLAVASCGFNFYEPIAPNKDETKAQLEEAKVLMDDKDYGAALKILEPLQENPDKDSNQVRLLLAAAILGSNGLDIWSIISKILDTTTTSSSANSNSSGADAILNVFSDSLLGTGEERAAKFSGLSRALNLLRTAPEPDAPKVQNTACFFAAMLVVPTVTDAQSQLTAALTALNTISGSGGSGETCSNINELLTPVNNLSTVATNFSMALAAAGNCAFLNFSDTAAQLNEVEQRLSKISTNADLGCKLPTCPTALPNCNALYPTCVQNALGVSSSDAGAGDGTISACELTLHCTPLSKCFD